MSVMRLFRDELASVVPWLSDRSKANPSRWVGFRMLTVMVGQIDTAYEVAVQGLQAPWPGYGTPTALSQIGRSRGILRGQFESDASYVARLRAWLDAWRSAGSAESVATQVHNYLASRPVVDVINRAGVRVRCAADGTLTKDVVAWNWDSTSNPERAGYWSELFVVVYATQWSAQPVWGTGRTWGATNTGLGSTNTSDEFDAVAATLAQWKAAHSFVRCLIVNRNATLPVPNGNWGMWHNVATDTPSSRDLVNNFFWDFVN